MTSKILTAFVAVMFFVLPAAAQQTTLDSAAVDAAIRAGMSSDVADVGLHKLGRRTDVWFGGPIRMGIAVYTPMAWIQLQAAKAETLYQTFAADDVTAEMKRPVLRVFLKPAIATHLVLRSTDKETVEQPLSAGQCQEVMRFEDSMVAQDYCQEFVFSLSDLAEVRNEKGEFLVTVIGNGRNILSGNAEMYEWDMKIGGGKEQRRLP